MLLLLAACGTGDEEGASGTSDSESEAGSSSGSETESGSGAYEEVDSIVVDGEIAEGHLYISDDGEVVNWGEKDPGIGTAERMKTWVNGEIEEMNPEKFDNFSYLHPEGKMFADTQILGEEGSPATLHMYDPRTGEAVDYDRSIELEDSMFTGLGYLSDEAGMIVTQTMYTDGDIIINLWDYKNDEVETFDITEEIYDILVEIDRPQETGRTITRDGGSVYVGVSEGIVHLDTETEEVSEVSIGEGMERTTSLTPDDAYLIMRKYNEEDEENSFLFYAADGETFEQTEIGPGDEAFPLTDGQIVLRSDEDLTLYDIESGETELFYTFELEEEQDFKYVEISGDGNTIAYAYEEEIEVPGEDKTEDQTRIRIVRRQF